MVFRLATFLSSLLLVVYAAIPSPQEHFGFNPGDDYKLADYAQVTNYFKQLARESERIKLVEFGRSAEGKPMYVAFISSKENLSKLDRYKEISRRLALGRATKEEAVQLAKEGKAIVWIDSGLHATEVAPVQQAPHLAYKLISDESEEFKRFRDKAIVMQIPVINPDGLDTVAHWYQSNVGTPYEAANLTKLYQKYSGHDNNRDWFMLNLEETRHVTKLMFQDWFPQIVYNQHQSPPFPARIFVPPYSEPLNPNIPAAVMEGIHQIGATMKERFARENKPGVLSYWGFDGWWNGGLRSVPAFHNMHGILTETAGFSYATPHDYQASELPERFPNWIPTKVPSIFYQNPWQGGKWTLRDAIDYMLTADFAILDLASSRSEQFLYKAWDLANRNIELGKSGGPYAYVVPVKQWDYSSAVEMMKRLQMAGIEVERARAEFQVGAKSYPAGTYVMRAGQPFRGYLMDLMEPQKYPEIRDGSGGGVKRPYDIAGWTLSMQMGVQVDRVEDVFKAELEPNQTIFESPASMDHRENSSFVATAELLAAGKSVGWAADGKIVTDLSQAAYQLKKPRLAMYEPWIPNMDLGWTQWVLDTYKVPYTLIHNEDFQNGKLRERFDTVLFATQSADSILHGIRAGVADGGSSSSSRRASSLQRPEFTGGIGAKGAAALEEFVQNGGTLITFGSAAELPLQMMPIGVRNSLIRNTTGAGEGEEGGGGGATFLSPGSLLRITVDPKHPIGFGMPEEAVAFSSGGEAFDLTAGDKDVTMVARYAKTKLLASGWISGERAVLGKGLLAEARYGKGRVILFGFRPQHRGQPFGTFKLLLNSIYLGSARVLR